MIPVGIDTLAIYTPRYKLDLNRLAKARGHDDRYYAAGLGQQAMAVPPPGEDIITMAANAAHQALVGIDKQSISMLLFATESGVDQSKAAGIYIHHLLQLNPACRVVELKQACYSATMGLQLALTYLQQYPHQKVLVIASDIARYGLGSTGESSQGAGAVAFLLSAHPRLMVMDPECGFATEHAMDFWRPNYLDEALVEGKYSSKLYLSMLETCWRRYTALSGRTLQDHAYCCYHTPVPRLVETAHHQLLKLNEIRLSKEESAAAVADFLHYARLMGNSYTAALYVGFASLLDHCKTSLANQRIGFYSYGSGCVAEWFSGVVQPGYEVALHTAYHQDLFSKRIALTIDEYEAFYTFRYPTDGGEYVIPHYATGHYRLGRFQQHKRLYETVSVSAEVMA
jgi:hydroxymethylglutaryl-CoA synthase